MADLIINFNKKSFSRKDYIGHIKETHKKFDKIYASLPQNDSRIIEAVSINIERFAGGQSPKSGGILELVDKDYENFEEYDYNGLVFSPFSNDFSKGQTERATHNNVYNP